MWVSHCSWAHPQRPHLLAVEDPLNPESDLGRNSFNFAVVTISPNQSRTVLAVTVLPNGADNAAEGY